MDEVATVTNGGVQHGCSIAPNTLQEYGRITVQLSFLCRDLLVQLVANNGGGGHLARWLIYLDNARPARGVAINLLVPGLAVADTQAFV